MHCDTKQIHQKVCARQAASTPTIPLCSDLIVLRSFIKMGEYCSRLRRYNRSFVVIPCKLTYSIQRVEQHNRNEFNFLSDFATKQLNTCESTDMAGLNTNEDFLLKQCFVLICIARRCPSMPNSTYHVALLSFLRGIPQLTTQHSASAAVVLRPLQPVDSPRYCAPSTTAISSAVKPYRLYTSRSISASAASI